MLILAGLLGALAAPAAQAQRVVEFADGGMMEVSAVERQDDWVTLELPGGSRLGMPAARILNWSALEAPAPARAAASHSHYDEPAPRSGPQERWRQLAGPYAPILAAAAEKHGLDPALLTAMAHVESRFDARAVSPKGAQGLLQLMPATASRFGVSDLFDAAQNVDGGAAYLSWLLEHFEGRTEMALAGYNAGENAVERFQGIPPYRETRNYVTNVTRIAAQLGAVGL